MPFLRTTLPAAFALALLPSVPACTAFTTTHGGRTFIGNNEDAWSINPQVRFEQGRDGGYGGIYFGHYNGHPARVMMDQVGMNEAGLVYDGLRVRTQETAPTPGLKRLHFDALMPLVMRRCATVQEARTFLKDYDAVLLHSAMIFMADKYGGYLIIENDTVIEGHDPWYAVGNWRMGSCSDPATIPIPRLQNGRALLAASADGSLEEAREVLARMAVCRKKMGEGTLFSTLFDPQEGTAQLYFYHDFSEAVTFDLKGELAKGDRTVAMASLFGPRPEFERLQDHITPFHYRGLFWGMCGLMVLAVFGGLWSLVALIRALLKRSEQRGIKIIQALLSGVGCLLVFGLLGVLLMQESPYYFGLGDVSPLLAWLPLTIAILVIVLLTLHRLRQAPRLVPAVFGAMLFLPLVLLLGYWGLLWP